MDAVATPARIRTARVWGCMIAIVALTWLAPSAWAHVIPSSTVQLAVGHDTITATVTIPIPDLVAASGVALADGSQADVDADSGPVTGYLLEHIRPTGDDGTAWTVQPGSLTVTDAGDPATTGRYRQLTALFTLTPPDGGDLRSFELGYTAIVDKVATHTVIVTVASDQGDPARGAHQVGVIRRDTVTNSITPLKVELGAGGDHGFGGMVALGMEHIADGTDHQLFLLTLLLPAPLLAARGRWVGPAPAGGAVRRITAVTLAFTLGHSVTLALGALGVPSPQGTIEALIAVSIVVAAIHAIRPIFPGREAVVAASFGLVHGLAFSETLRELDLSGGDLVTALLGFNLGIELMQLLIVAVVLPPLVLLARADRYRALRTTAAMITAVAALGWLAARLGQPNAVAGLADQLGVLSVPVVIALWAAALLSARRRQPGPANPRQPDGLTSAR